MIRLPALLCLVTLAACGSDPDARTTTAENAVAAKAIADVDAAMAEARRARPLPAPAAAPTKP
jgi:hypothetical protein